MSTIHLLKSLTVGVLFLGFVFDTACAEGQFKEDTSMAGAGAASDETVAPSPTTQVPETKNHDLHGIKLLKVNLVPLLRELAEPIGLPAQDRPVFEKLRTQRVSLAVTEMPLAEVVANLRDQSGLNVLLDQPSLEEEGVTTDTPVTAKLMDARLDNALARLLNQYNLTYIVKDGVLMITSQLQAGNELVARVYPVADLVWSQDPGPEIPPDFDRLIQVLEQTESPNSWSRVGGAGTIEPFTKTLCLVINQTQAVHDQIARTLELLRVSGSRTEQLAKPIQAKKRAELPAIPVVVGLGERELEIIKTAEGTPTTVSFVETPLIDVVEFLSRHSKLTMELDRAALEEEGITSDTPVTVAVSNRPLGSVLNLMLNQYNLTWLVKNDVVVITSQLTAGNELRTLCYPVEDLVVLSDGVERWSVYQCELMEIIEQTTSPNSWSSVGGAATVEYFPSSQILVINQTRAVHGQIQELFGMLRESADRLPTIVRAAGLPFVERLDQWRLKEALTKPHPSSQ